MENDYIFKSKEMTIKFCGVVDAEQIKPAAHMALISIGGPYERNNIDYSKWKNHIRVCFDDISQKEPDSEYKLFSKHEANQIISFVQDLPSTITLIIIHCRQGISRSSAVAKFLSEKVYPACRNEEFSTRYDLFNHRVHEILEKVWKK